MRAGNNQSSGSVWGWVGLILAVGWLLYWFFGLYNHTFLVVMIVLSIALVAVGMMLSRRGTPS